MRVPVALRELRFGSTLRGDMSQNFLNATAEIFRLLCIGFLNLVLVDGNSNVKEFFKLAIITVYALCASFGIIKMNLVCIKLVKIT